MTKWKARLCAATLFTTGFVSGKYHDVPATVMVALIVGFTVMAFLMADYE